MKYFTDNKEGLVFLALIGSHWLAVWLGVDIERTRNRHIQQQKNRVNQ